ncbi:MAG: riboflavin synthase [Alphaproteobacteria bacterium]|nr:riboflavin synthase [Alphaproteobacteria bacterium]MCW5739562.1 riboflavin synthase [Alphaproteobacteria bacterium]
MFTGIITDIGEVTSVVPGGQSGDLRFTIATRFDMDGVDLGASIACSGCCLTVTTKGKANGRSWFTVDVSGESLSKTTLGAWTVGRRINLERSLKFGDELGGHLVYGHVDGVARIGSITPEGGSLRYVFEAPTALSAFIASKGSVAIDGVSLTINEVDGSRFGVNIIPHTQRETTFGTAHAGDPVNLEVDMLARYVARQLEGRSS